MTIIFNSKSSRYFLLSNFYGGVEINYMKDRYNDPQVKELIESFETCDNDKFIYYLKKLQPGKEWTEAKINYWFKNIDGRKEPIRGILAKLVGGAVKNTSLMKKRREIIKSLVGLPKDFELSIKEPLNAVSKKQLMYKCLIEKFSKEKYKRVLLSTKISDIHEKPMRASNEWTYPGNDWLGQLLMKIRDEEIKKN